MLALRLLLALCVLLTLPTAAQQDKVNESGGGVYAQTPLQWSQRLRTIVGVRGDRYRFDVESSDPRNATMFSPKLKLYANAGSGVHSNDARGDTTPLARTRGAEIGLRTTPVPRRVRRLESSGPPRLLRRTALSPLRSASAHRRRQRTIGCVEPRECAHRLSHRAARVAIMTTF